MKESLKTSEQKRIDALEKQLLAYHNQVRSIAEELLALDREVGEVKIFTDTLRRVLVGIDPITERIKRGEKQDRSTKRRLDLLLERVRKLEGYRNKPRVRKKVARKKKR
jgi:hypothetical protein